MTQYTALSANGRMHVHRNTPLRAPHQPTARLARQRSAATRSLRTLLRPHTCTHPHPHLRRPPPYHPPPHRPTTRLLRTTTQRTTIQPTSSHRPRSASGCADRAHGRRPAAVAEEEHVATWPVRALMGERGVYRLDVHAAGEGAVERV